jgi:hypothetical protein
MITEPQEKEGSMAMNSEMHSLGVVRFAATGGVTAAVIFVLCWIGTFVPFSSPTHAYIGLFTPAEMRSVTALAEGTLWSLLFGTLSGALFAAVYNLFTGLDRR